MWWNNIVANPATPASAGFASNWVDVRDLGRAFILALQTPGAGGERLIVSAGQHPLLWLSIHLNDPRDYYQVPSRGKTGVCCNSCIIPIPYTIAHVSDHSADIAATHRSPLKSHEFPHHKEFGGYLPKGCPDIERKRLLVYNNAKAHKILGSGLTYRTMEETTRDILEDYAARGW
jgi:hypothetical protein